MDKIERRTISRSRSDTGAPGNSLPLREKRRPRNWEGRRNSNSLDDSTTTTVPFLALRPQRQRENGKGGRKGGVGDSWPEVFTTGLRGKKSCLVNVQGNSSLRGTTHKNRGKIGIYSRIRPGSQAQIIGILHGRGARTAAHRIESRKHREDEKRYARRDLGGSHCSDQ